MANAQPPWRLRAIFLHPPPPSTTAHCRFTWHTRNRATNARFRGFGPKPAPWPHVVERATPQPSLCHFPTPTTSQHHHLTLFYTAHLKPSHDSSDLGFWPKSHPRPLIGEGAAPAAASMPSTRTHHLPLSLHTTVLCHMPKTKLRMLSFGFLAQTPPHIGERIAPATASM